jgi:hypothetical protein
MSIWKRPATPEAIEARMANSLPGAFGIRILEVGADFIRAEMPAFCARAGIHRIEARCWAGHPTAASLLAALGFTHEADMPGFGPGGAATYRQFAWISPAIPRQP